MNARSRGVDERQLRDARGDARPQMVQAPLVARALRAILEHRERDRHPELGTQVARGDVSLGEGGWRVGRDLSADRQERLPVEWHESDELQPSGIAGCGPEQ